MPTASAPVVQEFPCPRPVTAIVRVGGGAVTVIAEDAPVAIVAVSPYDDSEASGATAENTVVTFSGDHLRVEAPESAGGRLFRRGGRVRVDLRVPLDSRLQAYVGSADVHAEGRLGDASVHSGSGDTYVTQTSGDLAVESGSGDVRVDRVAGALRVNTASGDVSATAVNGQVVVDVASGDIDLEDVGGTVRASSASGDITIAAAHGDQVKVNSASGDIAVGVPAGTLVWLDLSTVSGSTTSDLAMNAEAPEAARDGAQLSLQVRTVSGDIRVHRVGATSA